MTNLLDEAVRASGSSFKQAVNYYLLLGLLAEKKKKPIPFVVKALPLGLPQGLSYDNVGELLDSLEEAASR